VLIVAVVSPEFHPLRCASTLALVAVVPLYAERIKFHPNRSTVHEPDAGQPATVNVIVSTVGTDAMA